MKHFLITGGTGLIGSALCHQLLSDNHAITVLSRQPEKVQEICGVHVTGVKSLDEISNDIHIDAVINLAGAPVLHLPWSKARKQILENSRIGLTADLIDWLSTRIHKPDCLISGSAVGWYGDGGNSVITENCTYHDEYTHQLCDGWEQQARRAETLGIRVCIVRIGLVLSLNGGFLQKMLLPFKLGLGTQLGNGAQYMPWIHMNDLLSLIVFLVNNQSAHGVFNGCAPDPVTNKIFTKMLAKHLRRPVFLTVPAWILTLCLGEMSRLLTTGQRAVPDQARIHGFKFEFQDLDDALTDLFSPNPASS